MPAPPPPPFNIPYTDPRTGLVSGPWQAFLLALQQAVALDFAPIDAQYFVSTGNPDLSNERNLGSLVTGFLFITVAAGIAVPSSTLNGSALTNLNASALASGTVPDGRFPATLPVASGANLTNLDASDLATGTVPDARFPSTLPAVNGSNLTHLSGANIDGGGVYTPTLTNVTNLSASTAFQCQYARTGPMVMVSGKVSVDPTAAGATELGISLPIASGISAEEEVCGVAFATAIAGQGAGIVGDAANNRAAMKWIAVDLTDQPMAFVFMYQVI